MVEPWIKFEFEMRIKKKREKKKEEKGNYAPGPNLWPRPIFPSWLLGPTSARRWPHSRMVALTCWARKPAPPLARASALPIADQWATHVGSILSHLQLTARSSPAHAGSFPAKSAAPVAPYAVSHAYIGSSSADFPCDRRGEFKGELDS
jgi:hypothetical protein